MTEYTVVIFPQDAELARRGSRRRMRIARPDQQGRFRAEHLPPGEYLAAAAVDVDMQDGFDPDFLEPCALPPSRSACVRATRPRCR